MKDRSLQYELLGKLGTGSFGTVWKARNKESGEVVAIKQIDLESSSDDVAEIQQEITLLAECHSRHVTRYYESFVTGFRLWIVMEYLAGGSALDAMQDRPFSEQQTAVMCRELLEGLAYLHSQSKIHRDIKAANILLTEAGQVKLADFGVAAQLSSNMSRRHTFVGTPFWMAPEVIKQAGYKYKADIWSLGITTIELLKGEPPLSEFHPMRAIFLIPKSPAPVLTGRFSSQCKDFVSQCLQVDVNRRPSAQELLNHSFIRQAGSTALLLDLVAGEERVPETPIEELAMMNMNQSTNPAVHDDQMWDFDTIRGPKPDGSRQTIKSFGDGGLQRGSSTSIGHLPSHKGSKATSNRIQQSSVHETAGLTSSWRTFRSAAQSSRDSFDSAKTDTGGTITQGRQANIEQRLDSVSEMLLEVANLDPPAVESFLKDQLANLNSNRASRMALTERSPIAELLFMRWADELRKKASS